MYDSRRRSSCPHAARRTPRWTPRPVQGLPETDSIIPQPHAKPAPTPAGLRHATPVDGGSGPSRTTADTKEADARENWSSAQRRQPTSRPLKRSQNVSRSSVLSSWCWATPSPTTPSRGDALAEQLLSPTKSRVDHPGFDLAHWYALLKHHVFASDHTPALVLVVSSLQSMLTQRRPPQPCAQTLMRWFNTMTLFCAKRPMRTTDHGSFGISYAPRNKTSEGT